MTVCVDALLAVTESAGLVGPLEGIEVEEADEGLY